MSRVICLSSLSVSYLPSIVNVDILKLGNISLFMIFSLSSIGVLFVKVGACCLTQMYV